MAAIQATPIRNENYGILYYKLLFEKNYQNNVALRSCKAINSYQTGSSGNRPRNQNQKGNPNYRVEKVVSRHDVWNVGSLCSSTSQNEEKKMLSK